MLFLLLVGLVPMDGRGENAFRIADVSVQPGESFAVPVTYTNDFALAGMQLRMVWDTAMLQLDSSRANASHFLSIDDNFWVLPPLLQHNPEQVWFRVFPRGLTIPILPPGQGTFGWAYFTVRPGITDAVTFVDSLGRFIDLGGGFKTLGLEFGDTLGITSFVPDIHTGTVVIGTVPTATVALDYDSLVVEYVINRQVPDIGGFRFRGTNGVPFVWNAERLGDTPWLLPHRVSALGDVELTIAVDASSITPGDHSAVFLASGYHTDIGVRPLYVQLTAREPPQVLGIPERIVTEIRVGDSLPEPLEFSLTTSDALPLGVFTDTDVTPPPEWLRVDLDEVLTPSTLQIGFDQSGLTYGRYRHRLTVEAPLALNDRQEVEIVLVVRPTAPARRVRFWIDNAGPNPFVDGISTAVNIDYHVQEPTHVDIAVFNVLGQRVRDLENVARGTGDYRVVWDGRDNLGRDVASGVYFARVSTGSGAEHRKIMVIR